MLNEIFKKYPQVIRIHHEDELNSKEVHGEKKSYSMIEIQSMSFVEVLQMLYNNSFIMDSNSTYNSDKTTIQELIFLRHNQKHDDAMV